jgi:hypothetical protein
MKNNNGLLIGSGFAASLLAFGVTSGLVTFKDASIASLLAAPAALITHIAIRNAIAFRPNGRSSSANSRRNHVVAVCESYWLVLPVALVGFYVPIRKHLNISSLHRNVSI